MPVIDDVTDEVLRSSGYSPGTREYEAERMVMDRLLSDSDFRRSYVRGVGARGRSLTPTEVWAIEVGEMRTPLGGNQSVFRPSDVPREKDRLDEYRRKWSDLRSGGLPSGYSYPRSQSGLVGESYTNVSGSDIDSPLSDLLIRGR